ncbi:MAG: Stf0 family sulfotransferase [Alphaproteobacteria bacterium]
MSGNPIREARPATSEPSPRPAADFDPDGIMAAAPPDQAELSLSAASFDQPEYTGVVRPYVIATTQRTGSTLLCHLLAGTGAMGVPTEYVKHPGAVPAMAARLDAVAPDGSIRMSKYVRRLLAQRSTPNGVFGVKLHFHQLRTNADSIALRKLVGGAPHVWLRRHDLLAQAISFAIARATMRFHEAEGSARPVEAPPFDPLGVLLAIQAIANQDMGWKIHFQANAIVPLEIFYEELVADPEWVCRRVCALMGIEPSAPISLDRVPLRRQRSAVYDEWRARFLEHVRVAS